MSKLIELVPFQEPCVTVMKLRGIDDDNHEDWDRWCYIHKHWLNGAPAKPVIETLRELVWADIMNPEQHRSARVAESQAPDTSEPGDTGVAPGRGSAAPDHKQC